MFQRHASRIIHFCFRPTLSDTLENNLTDLPTQISGSIFKSKWAESKLISQPTLLQSILRLLKSSQTPFRYLHALQRFVQCSGKMSWYPTAGFVDLGISPLGFQKVPQSVALISWYNVPIRSVKGKSPYFSR